MSFNTITIDNIQSYFEYLEDVKSTILDHTVVNPTCLNAIVHEDEDFLKFPQLHFNSGTDVEGTDLLRSAKHSKSPLE